MKKGIAALIGMSTIFFYASRVSAMMHDGIGGMGGGMMGQGYGSGYGFGAVQLFFWVLLLAVIGGLAYYLVKNKGGTTSDRRDALSILKERYAKGEITREEFLEMKKDFGERWWR